MAKKGTFIVFEGGEGSGKTRHSQELAKRLAGSGHTVLQTREPGGSALCERIRDIILSEQSELLDPRAELLLFLADRAQHVATVIRPALERGGVVICDRFSGSTLAYQLGGRRLSDADLITEMEAYSRSDLQPDLVLYLDMPVADAMARKKEGREEMNRMDKEELAFHERVRAYFQRLAESGNNWHQLSTQGDKKENEDAIEKLIRTELGL